MNRIRRKKIRNRSKNVRKEIMPYMYALQGLGVPVSLPSLTQISIFPPTWLYYRRLQVSLSLILVTPGFAVLTPTPFFYSNVRSHWNILSNFGFYCDPFSLLPKRELVRASRSCSVCVYASGLFCFRGIYQIHLLSKMARLARSSSF